VQPNALAEDLERIAVDNRDDANDLRMGGRRKTDHMMLTTMSRDSGYAVVPEAIRPATEPLTWVSELAYSLYRYSR
jgi:hypothetical protein